MKTLKPCQALGRFRAPKEKAPSRGWDRASHKANLVILKPSREAEGLQALNPLLA